MHNPSTGFWWGLAFSLPPGFARRPVTSGAPAAPLLCGAGFSLRRALARLPMICGALLVGGVLSAQTITTQTLDLPAEGILHFKKSIGELNIEGWDEPRVEIAAIISVKDGYGEKASSKRLERVHVDAQRHEDEVAVDTVFPKRFPLVRPFRDGGISPIELEYRVKAPHGARLEIEHESGEVHLQFMTGDIRVTDGKGQITLYLPGEGQYSIDALSRLGAVDSDFPGRERRKLEWGHSLVQQTPSAAHKIYLRIGFGDITILKAPHEEPPAPAEK